MATTSVYGERHNQVDFIASGQRAVEGGLELLSGKKLSTPTLFEELLDYLGNHRHEIALRHGSTDAKDFGIRRVEKGIISVTVLAGAQYGTYGPDFVERITDIVSIWKKPCEKMRLSKGCAGFKKESLSADGRCLGLLTRTEIEVLDQKPGVTRFSHYDGDELERACKEKGVTNPLTSEGTMEEYQAFKRVLPNLYRKVVNRAALVRMHEELPPPKYQKSFYVVTTPRLEMNGGLVALSKLITFGYCSGQGDLAETMKTNSRVMVVHQDRFLIEQTLELAKSFFLKALTWNSSKPKKSLIESVGMVRYLLAHTMPFKRGSATIAEWVEQILYKTHEFSVEFEKPIKVDLVALTTFRAEEFMAEYQGSVHLT